MKDKTVETVNLASFCETNVEQLRSVEKLFVCLRWKGVGELVMVMMNVGMVIASVVKLVKLVMLVAWE